MDEKIVSNARLRPVQHPSKRIIRMFTAGSWLGLMFTALQVSNPHPAFSAHGV